VEKDRVNLWHIWEKACDALHWEFLVLIKNIDNGTATIYQNSEVVKKSELSEAKRKIKLLVCK